MWSLNHNSLGLGEEALAKIYEAVALLRHVGVCVQVRACGIFVRTPGLEDGRLDVRVIIADFERAYISKDGEHAGKLSERPASPIETFWDDVMDNTRWLAWDEWRADEELKYYRQWLVQRWGESTEYRPLSEDMRKRIASGEWGLSKQAVERFWPMKSRHWAAILRMT